MPGSMVRDFLQRRNGKRQPVADWLANAIRGEILSVTMTLTIAGQAVKTVGREHPQWAVLLPMTTGYVIWQGMCGNGAQTGMARITTQVRQNVIPPAPVRASGEFCAAVRGPTSMRTPCATPFAPSTTTLLLTRTTLLGFVAPSSFPFLLPLCVFAFMHLCICQRSWQRRLRRRSRFFFR